MLQIQQPASFDADKNYFEARLHLDWLGDQPAALKPLAVPVDLAVLMPAAWDALQARGQSPIEPAGYLKLGYPEDAKPAPDIGKVRLLGGPTPASSRHVIRDVLKTAIDMGVIPMPSEMRTPLDGDLHVVPAKLLLALTELARSAIDDAEAFDSLDLVLDKVALLMLMPKVVTLLRGAVDAAMSHGDPALRLAELRTHLIVGIKADVRLRPSVLSAPMLYDESGPLRIPKAHWIDLLRTLFAPAQRDLVWIPLGALEEWLNPSLAFAFNRMFQDLPVDYQQRLRDEIVVPATQGPLTYRVLYPVADACRAYWDEDNGEAFNSYKISRRGVGPRTLPVVEDIDARAQVWAREADSLAVERAIAQRAVDLFMKSSFAIADGEGLGEFYGRVGDLRSANRALFEVRRGIEALGREVEGEGYNLTNVPDVPALGGGVGLAVTRKSMRTRVLRIARTAVHTWTENYVSESCEEVRIGPAVAYRRCHPVYSSRTYSEVRRWFDTIVEVYTENIPINVDWNPIKTYLGLDLNERTSQVRDLSGQVDAGRTEEAKTFVRRALGRAPGDALKNGDKDVRIFDLYDNGYRDQKGFSLEQVLREAEVERVRARLLLILPIYERRIDGGLALMRYMAVHNPLAPRRSYGAPRVFLLEQYVNSFVQTPGHWLGALSHSVCLFPGEQRRIKIVSETRLVSQQRQESRSSQRNAFETKSNVRNQVRSELSDQQKDAKRSNWSANVSGGASFGFGSVSGGAEGGESREMSQEKVAKSLNDRVEEALSAASTQNEVQFATTSDVTQTQFSASEQTIEISNVNQGRAVTHKFFQVLHRFESKVSLENARLLVEYPEPVVAGLDIYTTKVFALNEIDDIFPELLPEDRARAHDRIRALVKARLGDNVKVTGAGFSFKPKTLDTRIRYVNSGAYFVDTEVASMPATEPYVEDARQAEIALQQARAERLRGEAKAIETGKLSFSMDEVEVTVHREAGKAG